MVNRVDPEFRDLQIASCNACIDRLTAAAVDEMPTPCPAHNPIQPGEYPAVDKLEAQVTWTNSFLRAFLPLTAVICVAGLFALTGHETAAWLFGGGAFLIVAALLWNRAQS